MEKKLVTDDDPMNLYMAERFLKEQEYEEIEEAVANHEYDVQGVIQKPFLSKVLNAEIKKVTGAKCSLLSRLSFLDTAVGIQYCADSEEVYEKVLCSYLSSDSSQDMCRCFEEEDWDNYRILMHALKSKSMSIGALPLSEQAKALEGAAKESDITYIRAHHKEVIELYQYLLEKLKEVLEGKENCSR